MDEQEIIVEKREILMVSPTNSSPSLRTAHFLNPTLASIEAEIPKNPLLFSSFNPAKFHLDVTFNGWNDPTKKWKKWVYHMEGRYKSVWKKAGIYEAIMSSTCRIDTDHDLIIGLAEKWCPETSTFIFHWAEATITLEDVMILGGFPVLGSPGFSCPLESKELEDIERKLKEAKITIGRRPSRKATQTEWMSMFMFSGSEIEHEAFLSFWLERIVFRDSDNILKARVFPVATRLAKGEIVALAPAVLASIYRDLGLLKATILAASDIETNEDSAEVLAVTLWSPMHLVQLWAWERFPVFQPKPNFIKDCEPRSALWDNVKGKRVRTVRSAIDSSGRSFNWRPYALGFSSCSNFSKFYKENEEWQDLECNQELMPFAICLRVSVLVGLGYVEQYLPHRVARQFGLDQDIPCDISRSNDFPELAWINYIRPFDHTKLFLPSKFFEPGVSVKYSEWWKQAASGLPDSPQDAIKFVVRKKRSSMRRTKWVSQAWIGQKGKNSTEMTTIENEINKENLLQDIKPTTEEMKSFAGQIHNVSNAKAKNENVTDMKPVENGMSVDNAIGRSGSGLEEKTGTESGIPVCGTDTFEIPGLQLEARITILEKAVAELKARRFGNLLQRNCC